ncbi:MAG TPA: BON domain-containing protein [Polyangiaceae bacterium]|nr:BON domain-containing protein [Polyangiaceae bacterium]
MKLPFRAGSVMLGISTLVACSQTPPQTADNQAESNTETSTSWSESTPPASSDVRPNAENERDSAPLAGNQPATAAGPDNKPAMTGTRANDVAAPSPATTPPATAPAGTPPDNTKVNKRDTNSAAVTPMDQGNGETDLRITQQIRQAVMADGSLSFTAKNVKIITMNGSVTLRGPVNTAAERSAIEAAARKVAGAQVDNQIEVKK